MQGIVIAGTHSGCGKTTITLGILAALTKKGYKVQPFKTGPDFIDSGLHRLVTGRISRNLDLWMCGWDYTVDCLDRNSADTDISVIEGVMGMHDGNISTADLAVKLGLPVILVVDAYGMAESAGAVVKGFLEYRNKDKQGITGVILNRVGSARHYDRLKAGIQDISVLGYLPRNLDFNIPHRHLGLLVAEENPIDLKEIDKLADAILEHVDIEKILQSTVDATLSKDPHREHRTPKACRSSDKGGLGSGLCTPGPEIKIAVAYDKAFCFYYEDNLDLLRGAGAEIIKFSPLLDSKIPAEADALYIGGGYPELYAEQLSNNEPMKKSVRTFALEGGPVYSECGGFMYLTEGISDFDSVFYSMAGVFPFKTKMKKRRARLGYREAILKEDSIIGGKNTVVRGHEFHYSAIVDSTQDTELRTLTVYSVKDGEGNSICNEGYKVKNTMGSYIHIHFGSNPAIAGNFIKYSKEHYGTDTVSRTR
jgi:cobyrinic acid a,c-diamide synthase